MKAMYRAALMAPAVPLLLTSVPVRTSEVDDSMESLTRKSYVFNPYLKGDDTKLRSKDGVSTFTGTVVDDPSNSSA
jgi:hypothetical protein